MDITALLLAGGKSSRMGTNKAMLPVFGGVNVQNIASELKKVAGQIMLITNSPTEYSFLGLPTIHDQYRGMGPLAGLHAGLTASKTETVIISACDMPFIKANVMEEMLSCLGNYEALVPEINGQLHPLFAIYRKSCLPLLTSCLEERELKMINLLNKLKVKLMKETDFKLYHKNSKLFPYLFYNMNNPDEYEEAKKIEKLFSRG